MRDKLPLLVLLALVVLVGQARAAEPWLLLYDKPATKWSEALPVGNGRLGAMVFGGVAEERIQFNEDTLWTGQPHEYQRDGAAEYLPQIRQLLRDGKQREAEKLAMQEFMSEPLRQKAYQPFGDILISFPERDAKADYVRDLNLDTAVFREPSRSSDCVAR
jgi:alpha-L-fucosidase 2